MKFIGLFIVFFLSTLFHLGAFFFMMVLADILPAPQQDARVFYSYFGVAVIFSGYAGILLSAVTKFDRMRYVVGNKSSFSNWLLVHDESGRYRINVLNAILFAAAVFIMLLTGVVAIGALNIMFGQSMAFGPIAPYLLATIFLVSVAVGIFTPVIYRLEREYRGEDHF